MNKSLILSLMFCGAISLVHGESQAEMNAKALEDFHKAELKLQQQSKRLIESNADNPNYAKLFESAQKAWLAYVDLQTQAAFPLAEGESVREAYGTSYPMELALLKLKLYNQRIELLANKEAAEYTTPDESSSHEIYKVIEAKGANVKQLEQTLNGIASEGWHLKTHVVGNSYIFSKAATEK